MQRVEGGGGEGYSRERTVTCKGPEARKHLHLPVWPELSGKWLGGDSCALLSKVPDRWQIVWMDGWWLNGWKDGKKGQFLVSSMAALVLKWQSRIAAAYKAYDFYSLARY